MTTQKTIIIPASSVLGYVEAVEGRAVTPQADGLIIYGELGTPQLVPVSNARVNTRGNYYERRSAQIAAPPVELVPELPPHLQVVTAGGNVSGVKVDARALAAAAVEAGGDLAVPLTAERARYLDPDWLRIRARMSCVVAEAAASADPSVLVGLARELEGGEWEYFGVGSIGKSRQSGSPAAANWGAYLKIGSVEDRVITGAQAEGSRLELEAVWRPNTATHYTLSCLRRDWTTGLVDTLSAGATIAETSVLREEFEAFLREARPCLIVLDSTGETGDTIEFTEVQFA